MIFYANTVSTTSANYLNRTNAVMQYFNEARQFEVLNEEEEDRLLHIAKESTDEQKRTEARQKIAECNQRLVMMMARYYSHDNFLDCVSEGTIGLMNAIDAFEFGKGAKFGTFAVHYIRREITQYLRDKEPSIKKTNISKTFHTISQARNEFIQQNEREPLPEELAEILEEKYDIIVNDLSSVTDMKIVSIDEAVGDDNDTVVGDMETFNTYSASVNDYETTSDNEYKKEILTSLFSILSPREKKVISMLFGVGEYFHEYDPVDVAEEVGVGVERVRQMRKSILEKLSQEYAKRSKTI